MGILRNRQTYDYEGNLIESSLVDVSWDDLRRERDKELGESDWRFTSDQTPSDEWVAYRAFLRDLPQNHDSANDAADAWNEYEKPEGA